MNPLFRKVRLSPALLLAFGLPNSAFAQVIEPAASAPSIPVEAWPSLDAWLSEQAGLAPDPSAIPVWQAAAAELLHAEPGLAPEAVAAKAFAKARGLDAAKTASLERSIASRPFARADDGGERRLLIHEGRIFAEEASNRETIYFERVRDEWRKVDDFETMFDLRFGGEFEDRGHVYVIERSHTGPIVSARGRVYLSDRERLTFVERRFNALHFLPGFDVPAEARRLDPARVVLAQATASGFTNARLEGHEIQPLGDGIWRLVPSSLASSLLSLSDRVAQERPRIESGRAGEIARGGRTIFSKLASKLGLGSGQPAEPSDGVWTGLSRWLEGAVGARLEPAALKRETASILRSEPDLPFAKGVSLAASRVDRLDAPAVERIEKLIATDGLVPVQSVRVMGAPMTELDGKLYVANSPRLSVFDGRAWSGLDAPPGKTPGWIGVIDGRLHASAFEKLYRSTAAGWELVFEPRDGGAHGPVQSAAAIGGKLYVGTTKGLYIEGRIERLLGEYSIRTIAEIGGRVLAATSGGVYELKGEIASPFGENWHGAHAIKEVGGEVYVGTNEGLDRLDRSTHKPSPELRDVGYVSDLALFEGKLFAAAASGLWVRDDRGWREASAHRVGLTNLAAFAGRLFATATGHVLEWAPHAGLPDGWQRLAVESLAGDMSPAAPAGRTPLESAPDGSIAAKGGRTIFSSLRRR